MSVWQQFTSIEPPFEPFAEQHFAALIVFAAALAAALWCARMQSYQQNLTLTRTVALFLFLTVLVWSAIKLHFQRFDLLVDLPLSLCNLFAAIAPLLFWQPSQRRHEVLYYLVMAGTLQAMVTPDLYVGFPSNEFFKYWIVHGGLVILVIHQIAAFRVYPRWQGIVVTFVWLNIYAAVLYPINRLIDANYFYLVAKPGSASVLDLFGPWPTYILVAELVAMLFFAVFYLPIWWIKKSSLQTAP